jgi:hypothetical protein
MASHLTEEDLWASNLASRLKLVQVNFADESASTRQGYIGEEIDRALKEVVPSKRESYLDALAAHFPAWQSPAPVPARSGDAATAPETPESLLERLIESASGLSQEAKSGMLNSLRQAGFPVPQGGSAGFELSPEMQKKLGLKDGENVDPQRMVKLAAGLTELVQALDQLVWTLWKQLAPRSSYRKESEFIKLVGPYLSGDAEVSTQVVAQPLERTRKLIAAFLGSVGRAGSTFAKQHVGRFAPEVIQDWARLEKKWNESLEYACWRKYQEHFKEHSSEPAIENEIQEAIIKATENLIMGRMAG